MWTLRGLGFLVWTCSAGVSVASAQGVGRLELDPDLDSIVERLGLRGDDRDTIESHWTNRAWPELVEIADARIEGEDYRGHALKYLAYLELKGDRKLATRTATRALEDLAKHPVHLARFIRKGLFANPTRSDFLMALMALAPVVPGARKVGEVRAAHIRALLGCGKTKEAVITNKDILKDLHGDADALLELARAICDSRNGRSMGMVGKKALDLVIAEKGENEALLLTKYRVLHDLLGQAKAALELGERILDTSAASDLNNWTWYLMTRRASAGKFRTLALMSARRMIKGKTLGFHEYDTIALAHYRNGLIREAVHYQTLALKAGGAADADYRRRMKKYEAALRAKPPVEKPIKKPVKKPAGTKK
jgi:hypothetical protein